MPFEGMLPMFVEVGRSQADAEDACMSFIFSLLASVLIKPLRADVQGNTSVQAGVKLVGELAEGARAVYNHDAKMHKLLAFFEAAGILFETALHTNKALPHTPSRLRDALKLCKTMVAEDSPLGLALRFGDTGKHLLRCAEGHVTNNAKDKIASATFAKALAAVKHCIGPDSGSVVLEDIVSGLQSIASATEQWGQNSKDEQADSIDAIFSEVMAWILKQSHCVSRGTGAYMMTDLPGVLSDILSVAPAPLADGGNGTEPDAAGVEREAGDAADPPAPEGLDSVGSKKVRDGLSAIDIFLEEIDCHQTPSLVCYIDMCESAQASQERVTKNMQTALPNFRFSQDARLYKDKITQTNDVLDLVRSIIESVKYFGSGGIADFTKELEVWERWGKLGVDERSEVAKPPLELIAQGAAAIRKLQHSMADRPASDEDDIFSIAGCLLQSGLQARFDQVLASGVDDAMRAVAHATKVFKPMLQDSATIERYVAQRRLKDCAFLLLGVAGKEATDLVGVAGFVGEVLRSNGGVIAKDTSWPHCASTNMAMRYLRLLEALRSHGARFSLGATCAQLDAMRASVSGSRVDGDLGGSSTSAACPLVTMLGEARCQSQASRPTLLICRGGVGAGFLGVSAFPITA